MGAKWADEHPNLEIFWYDASEELKGDNWKILCLTDYNEYWIDSCNNALFIYNTWHEYVDIEAVKMWAYLNDLLLKGYEKCIKLKDIYMEFIGVEKK